MPRKRKRHARKTILEDFADQVRSEHEDMKFLMNPKGEISMSDAISQLIEPYKDDMTDYNSFTNLVSLGCIAWNTSILPEHQRDEAIDKMVSLIPGGSKDRLVMLGILLELIERKRELFPNVSKVIIEHKVTDRGRDFHIAIASTMEKKDDEK